jgi:hypothetical protein
MHAFHCLHMHSLAEKKQQKATKYVCGQDALKKTRGQPRGTKFEIKGTNIETFS